MSEYTFRRAHIENDAEIKFIAEIDNTIPVLFDSDFIVNEQMNQDRMKFLKASKEEDFFDVALDDNKNIVAFHVVKKVPHFDRFAGRVDTLWIAPDHRKKGLASDLKTLLHTWIHSDNRNMILLNEKMRYRTVNYKMRKDKKDFLSFSTTKSNQLAATIAQPRLETTRLILEPYKDSDASDVFEYASNSEVTKFLLWEHHKTLEDSQNFLQWVKSSTSTYSGKLFFIFAIRLKETGKVIGSIDFKNPQPWVGQFDYAMHVNYWGKGLMAEAACAIRDWAFDTSNELVRIQSYCDPENIGSRRVMEKIGLTFEGIRKKSFKSKGQIIDLAHYALLRNL